MSALRSTSARTFFRKLSTASYNKHFNQTYKRSNRSNSLIDARDSDSWDYIYGLSSVFSALHSKKRSVLDTIYIQESNERKTTPKKDASGMEEICQLAKKMNIHTVYVNKGQLNNLTDHKPHQGIALKASPRDSVEISVLTQVIDHSYTALPRVSKRGSEEDREMNQKDSSSIPFRNPNRMPFWIALDEVQDPQNLGSILRTAYFFGVDGVLLCSKNSAPLSPTVSKVSSGAVEMMDIYSTPNLVKFLKESSINGWEIIGAAGDVKPCLDLTQLRAACQNPVVLVLGNEGTGLRTNVKSGCSSFVSIPRSCQDEFNGSVDSLNVGVATGVLVSSALS